MDVICECGAKNPSTNQFCDACGQYLGWNGSAVAGSGPQAGSEGSTQTLKAATSQAAPTVELPPAPTGVRCPECRRDNPPDRRFCTKCGARLGSTQSAATPGAGSAELRRREVANERAFRGSLPAIYRWRRVGLVVLVIAVVSALAVMAGAHPVGWAKARWYDIKGTVVQVTGVQATVLPATGAKPGKSGSGADPALLIDGTSADWHVAWTATESEPTCDGGTSTPTIELTLPQPERIRSIGIYAGLAADQPERALQFRPRTVGITAVGATACQLVTLKDTADLQRLSYDTKQPVSVIRISLDSAYPGPADPQQELSIREIQLLARPQ